MKRGLIMMMIGGMTLSVSLAQPVFQAEDTQIFERWRAYADSGTHDITRLALFFINVPYIGGTLEGDSVERLRVNLRQFDCFTFVETVVAFRMTLLDANPDFTRFCANLQRLRYRDGRMDGYLSRLHYTSEWLHDNQLKGILTLPSITGCTMFHPNVSFMSTHCERYPALKASVERCAAMAAIEKAVNRIELCYIPKTKLTAQGTGINDGDIIAVTTRIAGLDIVHVGFALRRGGLLYLLHASSAKHKVVVSEAPLSEYLATHKNHTGIIVGRLK